MVNGVLLVFFQSYIIFIDIIPGDFDSYTNYRFHYTKYM